MADESVLAVLQAEVACVQGFIEQSSGVSPMTVALLDHHVQTIKTKVMSFAGSLTFSDASKLIADFKQELWSPTQLAALMESVNLAVTAECASADPAGGHNNTQVMLNPEVYLPKSIHSIISVQHISLREKLTKISNWLVDLGAPNLNEKSRSSLIALLARISGEMDELTDAQLHLIYQEFKEVLRNVRQRRATEAITRIPQFPATFASFKKLYPGAYERVYQQPQDEPIGIVVPSLAVDAKRVPCRQRNNPNLNMGGFNSLLQQFVTNHDKKVQFQFMNSTGSPRTKTGLPALLDQFPTKKLTPPGSCGGVPALTFPGFGDAAHPGVEAESKARISISYRASLEPK